MDAHDTQLTLAGQTLYLLPERAVYWEERETLLVADLHWGKSETFRRSGIPIPEGLLEGDLERLSAALMRTQAKRLLVLGDLIHATVGLTPELLKKIGQWRAGHSISFTVIRGNHDRRWKNIPESWALEIFDEDVVDGPFAFSHHPKEEPGRYVWAGHLHPTVLLKGGGDELRLPCFYVGKSSGVLPAFSFFTRGIIMEPSSEDRVFIIAEDRVVEWA